MAYRNVSIMCNPLIPVYPSHSDVHVCVHTTSSASQVSIDLMMGMSNANKMHCSKKLALANILKVTVMTHHIDQAEHDLERPLLAPVTITVAQTNY